MHAEWRQQQGPYPHTDWRSRGRECSVGSLPTRVQTSCQTLCKLPTVHSEVRMASVPRSCSVSLGKPPHHWNYFTQLTLVLICICASKFLQFPPAPWDHSQWPQERGIQMLSVTHLACHLPGSLCMWVEFGGFHLTGVKLPREKSDSIWAFEFPLGILLAMHLVICHEDMDRV